MGSYFLWKNISKYYYIKQMLNIVKMNAKIDHYGDGEVGVFGSHMSLNLAHYVVIKRKKIADFVTK